VGGRDNFLSFPSMIISRTWHASLGSYHWLLKMAWHPCYIGILLRFWMLHVCLDRSSKIWAKSVVLNSPQESNGRIGCLFFSWPHGHITRKLSIALPPKTIAEHLGTRMHFFCLLFNCNTAPWAILWSRS